MKLQIGPNLLADRPTPELDAIKRRFDTILTNSTRHVLRIFDEPALNHLAQAIESLDLAEPSEWKLANTPNASTPGHVDLGNTTFDLGTVDLSEDQRDALDSCIVFFAGMGETNALLGEYALEQAAGLAELDRDVRYLSAPGYQAQSGVSDYFREVGSSSNPFGKLAQDAPRGAWNFGSQFVKTVSFQDYIAGLQEFEKTGDPRNLVRAGADVFAAYEGGAGTVSKITKAHLHTAFARGFQQNLKQSARGSSVTLGGGLGSSQPISDAIEAGLREVMEQRKAVIAEAGRKATSKSFGSTPEYTAGYDRLYGATHTATFGSSTSTNYKSTFFKAHPTLEGEVVVHHGVEQQVLTRFPNVVTESEIHSLENLRGIPKDVNPDLHLSAIRVEWNRFYKPFVESGTSPTKAQLLQKATEIDLKYGSKFTPAIGGQR